MATAVAAVVAFVVANAAAISLAISIASVGFAVYSAKKARQGTKAAQAERKQVLRSSTAAKTFLYGENISSGVLMFAEEQPGGQRDGERLHMVITHAGTPIDRVTDVYFNEEIATQFSRFTTIEHYPQGRSTVDQYLIDNAPSWEDDMIGQNFAWFRVTLQFDQTAFPSGVPNITARKFGRRVLDPRNPDAPAAYSENIALCLLDYVRNHPSLQYEDDELLISTFITAANICDELVNVHNSEGVVVGQEPRYRLTAEVDFNEDPSDVIDDMLAACAGEPIRIAGRFGINVGAYYPATTLTLNQDDIVGQIAIQPEASQQDSFNIVRGVYNSKDNNFSETDYPEVRFDDWIVEDGSEIVENLDLRFVNSPSQCQRVADITARRSRFGMVVEIPCNYRGMNYPPGSTFRLTLEQIAISNLEFKVLAWTHSAENGVTLICRREDPQYYGQRPGQNIVLPPVVNLPASGIAAPSNVQFINTVVGEVIQGQLSWRNTSFRLRGVDIVIYRVVQGGTDVVVQTASVPFPGESIDLNGKLSGLYRAELTSVAVTGQRSSIANFDFNISTPTAPDGVEVSRSNWNLQLVPTYTAGVIPPNTLFEFWYLADTASFTNDSPTFNNGNRDQAELLFTGSTFNHGGLFPDRWNHYWIRAVNAYGQSDYIYIQAGTTREQDLVTTVVERLVAIEIESSNFVEGSSGYRLDPNGDVEFNNGAFRGAITALSLTLGPDATIDYSDLTNPPVIRNGNRTFRQATAPSTSDGLEIGDLWIETDNDNQLYRWNGVTWLLSRDAGIAQAIQTASNAQSSASDALEDAANAQATADGKVVTFFQASQPIGSTIGDLWIDTDDENKLYRWNGSAWTLAQDQGIVQAITNAADAQSTADSKIVTFYQAAQPPTGSIGDLWFDIDDENKLYRYNGTSWQLARDEGIAAAIASAAQAISDAADAQGTADGKVTTFFQNNQPAGSASSVGDLWIDTNDSNKLYRYSGTAWVLAQDQGIAQAISDAASAQSTADSKIITYYQATEPAANISSVGDLWFDVDDDNKLYRYNGTSWQLARDEGIDQAIASAGQAITDAATAQDAAEQAQITADGKIETFFQTTAPAASVSSIGDLWLDTNDGNKLYRYSGTTWVLAQDQQIGQAIADAADAQATADGKITTFYQNDQPASSVSSEGDLWYDTNDSNRLYRYSGSVWIAVSNLGLGNLYPNQSNLSIRSSNYQQGSTGWAIDNDGSAELNDVVVRGTLFAPDIEGDLFSTVTWDVRSRQSHIANRGVPSEVEYLTFTIAGTPGIDRILVIPPIQCDTQSFRLYEDGVMVLEFDTINDPDGFDDITEQVYHTIKQTSAFGTPIVYSLRTYDLINPGSVIVSKAIRIPVQVVQMFYGKANVIITP